MATDKRRYSSRVVDGLINAPARAMLRAVGFTDADFTKPQIGIASTGSTLTPCNMHINALADAAAMGADEAGGKAVDLPHDHRRRRHLDGLARHALLARVARSDRRFDRDRRRRRRLRRLRRDRRLRQEHAGLRDGDGADGPAERVRLRRFDSRPAKNAAT